jgi:hypothetical protein
METGVPYKAARRFFCAQKNPPVAEGGMEVCELPRATDHRRQKERRTYSKKMTTLSIDKNHFQKNYF